jgi:hypothetical protein
VNPFDVLISEVPDPSLGPLLTTLREAGYESPLVTAAGSAAGAPVSAPVKQAEDLPTNWSEVRTLDDQSYTWPEETETYERYTIYSGETESNGVVHLALGEAGRTEVWGRDRTYTIAFLTSGAPQVPLVEFLETDDHEDSGDMLAIIRGRDGAKSRTMYGPSDALPDVYEQQFQIEIYRERIDYPGAWNKQAVIARGSDAETMLNHALLQARRRGDL